MIRTRSRALPLVSAVPLAAALALAIVATTGCAEKNSHSGDGKSPDASQPEAPPKNEAPMQPPAPTPAPPKQEPAPAPMPEPAPAPPPAPEPPPAPPPEKPPEVPPEKPPEVPPEKPPEKAAEAPKPALPVGNKPGMLVPEFSATAHGLAEGKVTDESMDSRKVGAVTVWMVSSSTCPVTKRYAPHVVELEKQYADKGVRFVHVYPNRTESVESKRKFHMDKGFQGSWIEDNEASIAKLLDAKKTPEIYLATTDGAIAYRGAIDDSGGDYPSARKHYLKDALDAVLAGKAVEVQETVPAG